MTTIVSIIKAILVRTKFYPIIFNVIPRIRELKSCHERLICLASRARMNGATPRVRVLEVEARGSWPIVSRELMSGVMARGRFFDVGPHADFSSPNGKERINGNIDRGQSVEVPAVERIADAGMRGPRC